jgi:hypothetical protein
MPLNESKSITRGCKLFQRILQWSQLPATQCDFSNKAWDVVSVLLPMSFWNECSCVVSENGDTDLNFNSRLRGGRSSSVSDEIASSLSTIPLP